MEVSGFLDKKAGHLDEKETVMVLGSLETVIWADPDDVGKTRGRQIVKVYSGAHAIGRSIGWEQSETVPEADTARECGAAQVLGAVIGGFRRAVARAWPVEERESVGGSSSAPPLTGGCAVRSA